MKRKLILINSIIISISLILLMIISTLIVINENNNNAKNQIKNHMLLITSFYDGTNEIELIDNFKQTNNSIRITIIDKAGNVIADSDIDSIEQSHSDRPEIKNPGIIYQRYSETMNCNMLYLAMIDEDMYIRISIPMKSINTLATPFITITTVVLVGIIILSISTNLVLIKQSLRPINKKVNELANLAEENDYTNISIDDLPQIIENINNSLNEKINKIQEQKDQINDLLNELISGVFVIDHKGNIKLINKQALDIFKMDINNVLKKEFYYLIRDIEFQETIKYSLVNKVNNQLVTQINERYYEVIISYNDSSWIKHGLIIIIRDVTDKISLDKTKREFFQNASHELKSPLTCIIGYQQLITEGIETNINNIIDYSNLTLKEARRMNDIVVDMLNLSKLERKEDVIYEEVNCKELLFDIINSLNPRIKMLNLTVSIEADDVTIIASKNLVDQLFRNLIDNSIKYNKVNGSINIVLTKNSFKISDTGIGVPISDQKHIFERFYRVDKAKSKELGGTGLGLAIVKHICELYGYNINLKSTYDVGTELEIFFNNNK